MKRTVAEEVIWQKIGFFFKKILTFLWMGNDDDDGSRMKSNGRKLSAFL